MSGAAPADERRRAAAAYLLWPLALADAGGEAPISAWLRVHLRQAAAFGIAATIAYLVLLALPLLVVVAVPGLTTSAVVWLYVAGLAADAAAAALWLGFALRCRRRALQGQLFAIPAVSALADRIRRDGTNGG